MGTGALSALIMVNAALRQWPPGGRAEVSLLLCIDGRSPDFRQARRPFATVCAQINEI
jgi:hypothetical protein